MASPPPLLMPPGTENTDNVDGSFDTAPSSPNRLSSVASSPERYFSCPTSPTITLMSTPTTSKARKKVSWSPLPPKMDHTPTRASSTPQLRTSEPPSIAWRPRTPITPPNPSYLTTPTRPGTDQSGSVEPFQSFSIRSPQQAPQFSILPGNPMLPLDICADGFLKTKKFEVICAVAMNIACMIPTDPPPQSFVSLNETPMHPWFESFVAVFAECFAKRLRDRNAFPLTQSVFQPHGTVTVQEDHAAFETELAAHVTAIFRSFNTNWATRVIGSLDNLFIDITQQHGGIATMAMRETTEKPSFPPKANWKVGDALHAFYKGQLRRFRGGVVRLIEERPDIAWMLTVPEQLERGIASYEQYYIANVRHQILVHNREA